MERRSENFLFFGKPLLNDMLAEAKQAKGVLSDASDNFFVSRIDLPGCGTAFECGKPACWAHTPRNSGGVLHFRPALGYE